MQVCMLVDSFVLQCWNGKIIVRCNECALIFAVFTAKDNILKHDRLDFDYALKPIGNRIWIRFDQWIEGFRLRTCCCECEWEWFSSSSIIGIRREIELVELGFVFYSVSVRDCEFHPYEWWGSEQHRVPCRFGTFSLDNSSASCRSKTITRTGTVKTGKQTVFFPWINGAFADAEDDVEKNCTLKMQQMRNVLLMHKTEMHLSQILRQRENSTSILTVKMRRPFTSTTSPRVILMRAITKTKHWQGKILRIQATPATLNHLQRLATWTPVR